MKNKLFIEEEDPYIGLTYIEYSYIVSYLLMYFKAEGENEIFKKMATVGITFSAFMKLFENFLNKKNKKLIKQIRPALSTLYFAGVLQIIFEDWKRNPTQDIPNLTESERRKARSRLDDRIKVYNKVKEYLPKFIHGPVLKDLQNSVNLRGDIFNKYLEERTRIVMSKLYEKIIEAEQVNQREKWEELAFYFYTLLGGNMENSRVFKVVNLDIDDSLIINNPDTPSRFEETKCSICLNPLKNKEFIEAKCGHRFHKSCAKSWKSIKKSGICPLCRQTNVFFGK